MPSVFSWTSGTNVVQLARQCRASRRAQAVTLSNVGPQSSHTAVDVNQTVEVDCEISESPVVDVITTIEASFDAEPAGVSVDCCVQTDNIAVPDVSVATQTERPQLLCVDACSRDDSAVHFYTGLENYLKVKFVLATLGPAAYCLKYMYGSVSVISILDQFFLVLIKLRQHKTNFELSKLFGVSEADVYNIFCTWIRFMSLQWSEIDIWPSRDLVTFFSPNDFRNKFPSTRVIVDGTECPVKKPALPLAQQSTFSTYKNRNTVKVLVGATPSGLISYVSPAFGGSTSDRQIVERSDLPDRCDSGDSVMADKGFDVQDLFANRNVAVNIPSFFRKKNQMCTKKVLHDRKVSSKRVHIERIIGLGKTYKILTHPLNTSETALASDIIRVCYMLCNFRKCIVPRSA